MAAAIPPLDVDADGDHTRTMIRLDHDLHRAVVGLAAALCTLAACTGDDKDTATTTDTTQTNPSTTTGGPDTDPTTTGDATGTSTTDPTTGAPMTTSETTDATTTTTSGATTSGDTTSDTTTGGDLDQACQAACDKIYGCFPDEFYVSVDECKSACFAQASGGPACSDAAVVFNDCQAMMSCDDLLSGLIDEEYGMCQDEFDAFTAACA